MPSDNEFVEPVRRYVRNPDHKRWLIDGLELADQLEAETDLTALEFGLSGLQALIGKISNIEGELGKPGRRAFDHLIAVHDNEFERYEGKSKRAQLTAEQHAADEAAAVAEFAQSGGAVTPRKPRGRQPRSCLCGCGEMTKGGRFVPGHDARLKGQLLRVLRNPESRPDQIVQAGESMLSLGWAQFMKESDRSRYTEASGRANP